MKSLHRPAATGLHTHMQPPLPRPHQPGSRQEATFLGCLALHAHSSEPQSHHCLLPRSSSSYSWSSLCRSPGPPPSPSATILRVSRAPGGGRIGGKGQLALPFLLSSGNSSVVLILARQTLLRPERVPKFPRTQVEEQGQSAGGERLWSQSSGKGWHHLLASTHLAIP